MKRHAALLLALFLFLFPVFSHAQVVITEIMYAPEEGVAYEWFEILNEGSESVDLTEWRFNDGTNHVFEKPPKNGGQGTLTVSPNAYAIIAKEADTFLNTHQGFSGTVIDGSFSLTDIGDILSLANESGVTVGSVSYGENAGAQKNGLSIQLIQGQWIAALPTPGVTNDEGGGNNQETAGETLEGPVVGNSESIYAPEPKQTITVSAGQVRRVALVGAPIAFRGSALGLKSEPIENVRFLWSFGDGERGEGSAVSHTYRYPGEYIVVLEGSSGGYAASAKINVMTVPSDIAVSGIGTPQDFFIAVTNNTKYEVNLEGWVLRSEGGHFMVPANTLIASGKTLRFAPQVTGLAFSGDVALLYPNGNIASAYIPVPPIASPLPIVVTVSKDADTKALKEKPVLNNEESASEKTQVAAAVGAHSQNNSIMKWLFGFAGLMLMGFLGFFFVFRAPLLEESGETVTAEDFTILEEKE
ncbi:MAG: lamin tail domain-containing protein [Parcubacteria group bacterium]|nr:lamin tail domain-containing protein [Parcubacteria group bacterium]